MKNLIDELHKLDDYEYKVSADFSKKVMKSIKKEKKSNKISYVISWASIGVVACFAVFAFYNTDIKTNLFNYKESSKIESDNVNKVDLDYSGVANYDDIVQPSSMSESNNIENFSVNKENITPDATDSANIEEAKNEIQKNTMNENTYSGEQYYEVEEALKNSNIEYEKIDNEFKVSANIEEITKALKDFRDITIEIQEDYIIVEIKE